MSDQKTCSLYLYIPVETIFITYENQYARDPVRAAAELSIQAKHYLLTAEDPDDLPELTRLTGRVTRDAAALSRAAAQLRQAAKNLRKRIDSTPAQ